MSNLHHTPIPTGSPANAITFNSPLGELDQSIIDLQAGDKDFSQISFAGATTLTIASGVITPTQGIHIVAAESSATDNLDTITAVNNSLLILKADTGDTIQLTTSGNIENGSIYLTGDSAVMLYCQNSVWTVIGKSFATSANGLAAWLPPGNNTTAISNAPSSIDAAAQTLADRTRSLLTLGLVVGLEVNAFADEEITVTAGYAVSETGAVVMQLANGGSIDLTTNGINALDTGSITTSAHYYVWICMGTSGTGLLASTSSTSPTLPSGYNTYKRRIGHVVTNSGSATLRRQFTQAGAGYYRAVYDMVTSALSTDTDIGDTSSPSVYSLVSLLPVSTRAIILQLTINTPGAAIDIWARSDDGDQLIFNTTSTSAIFVWQGNVRINTSRQLVIYGSGTDEDISVRIVGYIEDLISEVL